MSQRNEEAVYKRNTSGQYILCGKKMFSLTNEYEEIQDTTFRIKLANISKTVSTLGQGAFPASRIMKWYPLSRWQAAHTDANF